MSTYRLAIGRLPSLGVSDAAEPKRGSCVLTCDCGMQSAFYLKQNPTMFSDGRQRARQAAAMREAVQLDEDDLAAGSAPRGAVAAVAQPPRTSSSLLARAVADSVAPDRPHSRRVPVSERLGSKPEAAAESNKPTRGRRGRWGSDEEDREDERAEDRAKQHKKHKRHRHD